MGTFRGGVLLPHPPVLLPAVGGADSERAARTRTAVELAAKQCLTQPVDTIVIMTPHAPRLLDAIAVFDYSQWEGSLAEFHAPEVSCSFAGDRLLAEKMLAAAAQLAVPAVQVTEAAAMRRQWPRTLDHGAIVPLAFLAQAGFGGQVVVVSPGELRYEAFEQFGRATRRAIEQSGRSALVVASGDLSHYVSDASPYGKRPQGRQFDQAVQAAIGHNSFSELLASAAPLAEAAGECGFRSLCFLFGAAHDAEAALLSYEAPFGIGYAVATWLPKGRRSA